jgi:hypothetical protein
MGGIATDLLPGDVELARRAAGGDGAAFVRIFDSYSADVFEASLAATGAVETAADATQRAFLKLLRRPPAMDAPSSEVAARLHALALSAADEAVPMSRRTAFGAHAPAGAGIGWLRSETVAKAAARFDRDWSAHLEREAPVRAPVRERIAAEQPLVVAAAPAPAAPSPTVVDALPPLRALDPAAEGGRFRPRRIALRSPAVAGTLLLLSLLAGGAGMVLAGADGEQTGAERAVAMAEPARGEPATDTPRRAGRRPARGGRRPGGALGPGAAERALGGQEAPIQNASGVRRVGTGGRIPAVTRDPGPQTVTPVRHRMPTAIKAPAPPEPTTTPAAPDEPAGSSPEPTPEPEPAPAEPAPAPRETGSGGSGRNCNSKNSANPC